MVSRKMGLLVAAAVVAALFAAGCPQREVSTWSIRLGGDADDAARAIEQTPDGGYVLAGYNEAYAEADTEAWLAKLDRDGNVQWDTAFTGDRDDEAFDVALAADGGYAVAGRFGDEFDPDSDGFLLKANAAGTEEWRRTFDSGGADEVRSVVATSDGGYLLGVNMNGLDLAYPVMIKTDASGSEQWHYTVEGGGNAAGAVEMANGDCVLAWWNLVPGDKQGATTGAIGLARTDAAGNVVWGVTLPSERAIALEDLCETSAGGLALTGEYDFLSEDSQMFLWNLNAQGAVVWTQTYHIGDRDAANAVRQTGDGGFVLAGTVHPEMQQSEMALLKTDAQGTLLWQRAFGGDDQDLGWDVALAEDGGYVVAGAAESFEKAGDLDHEEAFVVKTDAKGLVD